MLLIKILFSFTSLQHNYCISLCYIFANFSNTAANPNPELDLLLKKGLLPDDVNSLSVEDWMEWIATPAGQAFLKLPTRESAWSMHQNGDLKKILHRPDWPSVCCWMFCFCIEIN